MSNIVELIYKLHNQISPQLVRISKDVQGMNSQFKSMHSNVSNIFSSMSKMAAGVGIGLGAFQLFNSLKAGVEKAHELAQAQAQLKNTMQNMGKYSEDAYGKIINGSSELSKKVLYSRAEIIRLQSQLGLLGNVGEKDMQRLIKVSADMATKFGMGLEESGGVLAKAVNNPEMMMRLGQRLKIDPAMVEHLQKLAKGGHEAQARLELLAIVEQKVGGAAEAAFNANPMAKFNKTMGSMMITLGEVAIKIQEALAPMLLKVGEYFKKFALWVKDNFEKIGSVIWSILLPVRAFFTGLSFIFQNFKKVAGGIALFIGSMAILKLMILQTTLATKGMTLAIFLQTEALRILKVAQAFLMSSPITAVIVAASLLVGAFVMLKKRTKEADDQISRLNSKAAEYASDERSRLDMIFDKLKQTNPKSKERNDLVNQLKEMYPDVLKNMDLEKANLAELATAYDTISIAIERKAKIQAIQDDISAQYKTIGSFERNAIEPIVDEAKKKAESEGNPLTKAQEDYIRKTAKDSFIKNGSYQSNFADPQSLEEYKAAVDEKNKLLKFANASNLVDNSNGTGGKGNAGYGNGATNPTSIEGLTGGGSKATNVTINLRNLIENNHIHTQNFKEGVEEGTNTLIESLLRVVNSANKIATQ